MPEHNKPGSRPFATDQADCVVALLYHELRPEPSAYSYVLPCRRFHEHLRLFDQLAVRPSTYSPVLTFDDGHLSNYDHALPALLEHGRSAHFFITAGWTGQRTGYMRPEHLRALHAAGQNIGAHGWSHKLLTQCSAAELRQELNNTRSALEDWISAPVTSISLPGGRANERVITACGEAGYASLWTSVPGAEVLPLQGTVGRFNVHASATDNFLEQLLDPSTGLLQAICRKHRWKQHLQRLLGDRMYGRLWAVLNHQEAGEPEADVETAGTA